MAEPQSVRSLRHVTGRRQVRSDRSSVCSATRRISGAAAFVSALVFFWMMAGIGTANSAPCPPGTVPAPPPLSGCLVLTPCPAGTVPAPPPLSGCLVLVPNSSPAPTTSTCPPFQSSDPSGNCVCFNGSAPGANGFCPGPNICLLGGTCCPPGSETGTGTCCPQGQNSDVRRHLRAVQPDNCQDHSERRSLSAVGGATARRHLPL